MERSAKTDSIQDVCLSCNRVYGDRHDYDVINVTKVVDKIKSNCGRVHITDWQGDGYYIFTEECKAGDYCKTKYLKLDECYYEQKD